MRGLLTFCFTTASLLLPQSAQQLSRQTVGGQCLAPLEGSNNEVPPSCLLQVRNDGHHGANSDKRIVAFKRAAPDGPANPEERKSQSLADAHRSTQVPDIGSKKLDSLPTTLRPTALTITAPSRRSKGFQKLLGKSLSSVKERKRSGLQGGSLVKAATASVGSNTNNMLVVPTKNDTVRVKGASLAQTFMAKKAGTSFLVAIITTIFISVIVTVVGYFMVWENSDAKLWQRNEEIHSAPATRGFSVPRPPELMGVKDDGVRRDVARTAEVQRYSTQSLALKSPRSGSRGRLNQNMSENSQILNHSGSRGSIPPQLDRPTVDGSMSGDGAFWLCPGLVVPDGNECILAIRAILTPFAVATPSMIDILDLQGKVVLKANISGRPAGRGPGSHLSAAAESPAIVLRTTSPDSHGQGEVLGFCRQGDPSHSRPSMYIYNAKDEHFGTLIRDSKGSGRWVFQGIPGSPKLLFDGNYFERSIIVTDHENEQVADTETWTGDFDARGEYYKLRVVSRTDVGLILCGLLSIEWLETSTMQP